VREIAQDPQRVYVLEKVRCICESVYALEKIKEKEKETEKEGKEGQEESSEEDKMKKRLAAVPSVLWPRVRGEGGLPCVWVCVDGVVSMYSDSFSTTMTAMFDDEKKEKEKEEEEEDETEKEQNKKEKEKLQAVLTHVVNGDGLKPELFIELMAMMEHPWYSQTWVVDE
jgi:hypothetical protein